jgi:hypothetical protein
MNVDFLDLKQLEQIDELCLQYGVRTRMLVEDCPALRLLHEKMGKIGLKETERSRRIALAFEIKLVFLHVHYEVAEVAGLENRHIVHESDRLRYRPLEDVKSFGVAIERARAGFALVTRVRALWDKLFLYIALTVAGEKVLNRMQNQKSMRKFFFREFSAGFDSVSEATINKVREDLENLERAFRTPELHGFGRIKGWIFDSPELRISGWPRTGGRHLPLTNALFSGFSPTQLAPTTPPPLDSGRVVSEYLRSKPAQALATGEPGPYVRKLKRLENRRNSPSAAPETPTGCFQAFSKSDLVYRPTHPSRPRSSWGHSCPRIFPSHAGVLDLSSDRSLASTQWCTPCP